MFWFFTLSRSFISCILTPNTASSGCRLYVLTNAKYDLKMNPFANVSPKVIDFISKLLVKDLELTQCLNINGLQRRPRKSAQNCAETLNIPPAQF
ncbi:hypothetical protein CVS40_5628 [Lucilia cuprina]|nr:hypothetical protein CVS40_5628 [Lucilia cuprina]